MSQYLLSSVSFVLAQGEMPAPGPVESLIALAITLAFPLLVLVTLVGYGKSSTRRASLAGRRWFPFTT
ncbi:MAG: hypothetical protein ACKOFW_20490 [Planctomycetaceae bacterium]